ncbi:hypothetical protein ATE68_14090 [Sphingopyxis sp. H038]|uniref:DUF1489 family protein n=2 Tax=unclassified Sphingopyxis TaxID=2614943 RepID=UPI00073104DF|nr:MULTISPECIES: DUF1489 domain-containing protein [unclassified Sphingopyxis]KTE18041.1 hypothetical protein ATE75_23515 [Sphingopyxis sp. H080]KTE41790.1 hypothetical protein ATE77_17515 [Sphingopyxis sp. H005]KTE44357.1 hypothetical protein ATE73_10915 [Sphingopyxis sp. H077]KTE00074.1 hypothetical protein ATE78_19770 [Sphingopyxis sp. H012]KTE07660.1 hypothetical protein ATE70_19060 [Sphingopyxis sp. H053]
MSALHMTRVAVGCTDYPALEARIANYAEGGEIRFATRFRPKRADELIGGKLHFIVKHTLVARVEILRFDDRSDGRVDIVCVAGLERVHPQPKRAHQGWRYLADADAPKGVGDQSGVGELPPELYRELAELMLI